MSEHDPKENKRRQSGHRAVLIGLMCVCVLIMLVSLLSILHSLRLMREYREAPSVPETADPYFVPTPEPTVLPTPRPTPISTPEPAPESPWGWKEYEGQEYYLLPDNSVLTGLHLIDGKLHYFDEYGHHASSLGIDVSYHNKGINWDAVRAQGVDFAVIRLGYRGWETGMLHEDTCFRHNLLGAKAAGLKVGVYIYSTAVNAAEAKEEAALVLSLLNGVSLDLPVYFDTEQSGDYPRGRADRLHKVRRYEIITSFCRAIEDGGYAAGVYSGQNYLKNHVEIHTFDRHSVWLASYTRYNRLPDFPYAYDMWQFTDRAVVAGIRGLVDMSAVFS